MIINLFKYTMMIQEEVPQGGNVSSRFTHPFPTTVSVLWHEMSVVIRQPYFRATVIVKLQEYSTVIFVFKGNDIP